MFAWQLFAERHKMLQDRCIAMMQAIESLLSLDDLFGDPNDPSLRHRFLWKSKTASVRRMLAGVLVAEWLLILIFQHP